MNHGSFTAFGAPLMNGSIGLFTFREGLQRIKIQALTHGSAVTGEA